MNNFIKHIGSIVALTLCVNAFSQSGSNTFNLSGRGAFTTYASDYQSLGINPANLGFGIDKGKKRFALGSGEFGLTTSSSLYNSEVIKDIESFPFNFDVDASLSYNDFQELSTDLQDGLTINAGNRWFGGAITVNKVGTFALTIQDSYTMDFGLSKDFAEITTYGFGASYFDSILIQNGGNPFKVENTPQNYDSLQADQNTSIIAGTSSNPKTISELLKGTNMNVSWLREYAVGFGRHILETESGFGVYVGGSVKYIQGIATFDVSVNDNNELDAFGAYSPSFKNSQNGGFLSSGGFRFSFPKAAGHGYGIDLGGAVSYKKIITIGAAVNNVGSVTWSKNTFNTTGNTLLDTFRVGGFYYDSSAIQNGGGAATFDSVLNSLIQINTTSAKRTIPLASTARFGIGVDFKLVSLGVDVVVPFDDRPGSLNQAIFSFGGSVNLGPVRLSTGVIFGGNYLARIPAGIVFAPGNGTYEMGISTQDVVSLISFKSTEKPILSGSFGFARFKF